MMRLRDYVFWIVWAVLLVCGTMPIWMMLVQR
jgi:hypothetical protein